MAIHTVAQLKKNRRVRTRQAHAEVVITLWRIYAVLVVCMVIIVLVTLRLVDLQITQHETLSALAHSEIKKHIVLRPERGMITDYHGNVLAMDVERQSLWASPSHIDAKRAPRLALTLASLVDRDVEHVLERLTDDDHDWVLVTRWLQPSVAEQIAALEEPGLYLIYEPRRLYPHTTFAADIIGAVNDEGDGISGVESFYNTMLKGITGTLQAEFDATGSNPIAIAPQHNTPARNGVHLRLTIDPVVQHIAETELKKGIEAFQAESGTVIILEPSTGAIRAMVNWPSFDLNTYGEYSAELYGRNPSISDLYEPGSTFKIITVAAGLQSHSFTADTLVYDPGIINRDDIQIHNWNHLGNGMIDPADMLYHSSNVGAVELNEITGPANFYRTVYAFGFGAPTGVDLGGEERGIVNDHMSPEYNDILLRTNAYGQGIAMTPIQLVRGVAAIANDGVLMKPYVVDERCWDKEHWDATTNTPKPEHTIRKAAFLDGTHTGQSSEQHRFGNDVEQECITTRPTAIGAVVDPGVAWTIRRMLVQSANHYAPIVWKSKTGSNADQWFVPGYEVCAKTGTASIPLAEGGYDPNHVIGSVVGFAPAENARYAILVKIDRPQKDAWGVMTTVPVFYEIVDQLMRYERLQPNPALFSPGQ